MNGKHSRDRTSTRLEILRNFFPRGDIGEALHFSPFTDFIQEDVSTERVLEEMFSDNVQGIEKMIALEWLTAVHPSLQVLTNLNLFQSTYPW